MRLCVFTGARPNFIKVAPIVRAVKKAQEQGYEIEYHLVYAGSENDPTLEPSLFDDLQIHRPDVFLGVDCENLNELTGQVMSAFEKYLQANKTDAVIVVDDLASTMAAAIVTKKQGILLAHLVAGTRSFDINMPKEINRLVIDGLSDLLFTAGFGSNSNATREGAELSKIYMVGNILMDTLRYNRNRWMKPAVIDQLGLNEQEYLVFTLNRKALIADTENLRRMLIRMITSAGPMPIIAPLRGRAAEAVRTILNDKSAISDNETSDKQTCDASSFHIIDPLNYLEFGWLTKNAKGIITDSGNVAEEATFNGVPCITLNSYTEHIETVKTGSNVLVGEDAEKLGEAVQNIVAGQWKKCAIPDRWDGRSAERIVQIIIESGRK